MDQFINARDAIVTDAIEGVLSASGGSLARLDGFPHIKVVVRTDWDKSKVALVSGGGSGHEPAHAGFVGKGLLTAAVCGDVFASPSVDAVLAGILSVSGKAGCLLIVKNYTGDRLNFGLAAERARTFGVKVRMVIVDDDIALPDLPQARGVAGTLFVHKIAGAMAEAGDDLDKIATVAENIIEGTKTIGMSLDTCTIPGSPKEERIALGKAELGLGIHREAGVEQVDFTDAHTAMLQVTTKLAEAMDSSANYVALLNNLGGTTPLEMSILADELRKSPIAPQLKWIIGPGLLMTSLDMRGFSLSVLPVSPDYEKQLLSEVGPNAWASMQKLSAPEIVPLPDGLSPIKAIASEHAERKAFLARCCDILIDAEAALNALDAKSGDGDTGSTLAGAARSMKKALPRLPLADMTQLYRAIGTELSQTMGGSSGVLLAIFFTAAGDASASGQDLAGSLKAGMLRIQEVGGASLGDRTMIDALSPALDALAQDLSASAKAARKGADKTASIVNAKAGRATYVSADKLKGHNDPGAEAVAILLESLVSA